MLLKQHARILLLDRVQDPGNVGTLARTALALGVTAVFISPDSADLDSPKVLRASAGALFRLAIADYNPAEHFSLDGEGHRLVVPIVRGGTDLRELRSPSKFVLVAGNEGRGSHLQTKEELFVTSPMRGGVESLNVGAAAAIVLAHLCS
jgi:TrmH family RNA methyltransferase